MFTQNVSWNKGLFSEWENRPIYVPKLYQDHKFIAASFVFLIGGLIYQGNELLLIYCVNSQKEANSSE